MCVWLGGGGGGGVGLGFGDFGLYATCLELANLQDASLSGYPLSY